MCWFLFCLGGDFLPWPNDQESDGENGRIFRTLPWRIDEATDILNRIGMALGVAKKYGDPSERTPNNRCQGYLKERVVIKENIILHFLVLGNFQIRSFFWSVFYRIPTEYGPEKTPYLDTFRRVSDETFFALVSLKLFLILKSRLLL